MATKDSTFKPKKTHYMAFNEAVAIPAITLYGRLVEGGEAKPSDLGISHPSDPGASLHRSIIFGYATGAQCKTLVSPQQIWLPTPDGPADGCNWDPAQYVVWKNVPSDWNTVHVVAIRKPLSQAIAAGELFQAADTSSDISDDQIVGWIQEWAAIPNLPKSSDVLAALWARVRKTDFVKFGAPALAESLADHNVHILPQSITATLTVQGLLDELA